MRKFILWMFIALVPLGVKGDLNVPNVARQSQTIQDTLTAVQLNGVLSVQEGVLVNQFGLPPQLHGMSFSWSVWQGEKYYTPEVVDWLVDDFKVNLIRLSMAIEPHGGYLEFPEMQKKKIENLIDQAIQRGIYVLIDWHDHHADQNIEASKLFFMEVAQQYHEHPNIIYEIWNEPVEQSWPEIKAYSEEVIATIRKYDEKNIIIVGSPRWDQDVDVAALDPVKGDDNLVYSFHFYASDPFHQEKLREKAEKAMALGLPLFVTEWGVGESNGDGEFNLQKANQWVDWMEKHQLSWANWNITDKDETTAILTPKASPKGNWKAEALTPAGQYIRTILHQLTGRIKANN